ncbi:hypothetical protein BD324DRAFT_579474 [Kockovaella imperatae]|uniref:GlcNAc kinase n=1 Tax=Kockovaella imperatae TaxID=4999 RepID=A0A1Y1UH66_9TREE|nr:hypothetical protein BD324DRAFT_579474 [Kockovaella imperatae]ORX37403.1 hypothetical protein BD324DRAFT_579474 [Kockovaella imperatae]
MTVRLDTVAGPAVTSPPPLVLCADGGGSKVCVVIRSADGVEVRGVAGPCNTQSVGFIPASQAILLATYRALARLPPTHVPANLAIPPALLANASPVNGHASNGTHGKPVPHLPTVSVPATPRASRPPSPTASRPSTPLPPLNVPVFRYAWLALAGISTAFDSEAFVPHVSNVLNLAPAQIKVTNDVNLLAAPALDMPNIKHVVCVVCGTGTVGRTIRVARAVTSGPRQLPLEDVAVSRGWGYMLCDEGSAFWLGRLCIRLLMFHADRHLSTGIFSGPPPTLLPLHRDLLTYFGTQDPMDLIELVSLTGRWVRGTSGDVGEISAQRNAKVAGAARVVLRWAFPEDSQESPPSPPNSSSSNGMEGDDPFTQSTREALRLAKMSITPMIDLTTELLGDGSIVQPGETALALGGGLMMSRGYRGLLLDGLKKQGIEFGLVQVIDDAAGVGAMGLSKVEFGD